METHQLAARSVRSQLTSDLATYSRLAIIGLFLGAGASVILTAIPSSRTMVAVGVLVIASISAISIGAPGTFAKAKTLLESLKAQLRQTDAAQVRFEALLMSIESQLAQQSLEIARLAVKPNVPELNTLEELRTALKDIQVELRKYVSEGGHVQLSMPASTESAVQPAAKLEELHATADTVVQKIEASLADTKAAILEQVKILNRAVLGPQQKSERSSRIPEQIEMEFLAGGHLSWQKGYSYGLSRALPRLLAVPPSGSELEAEASQAAERLLLLIDAPFGFYPLEPPAASQGHVYDYLSSFVERYMAGRARPEAWHPSSAWPHEPPVNPLVAHLWASCFALLLVNQRGGYERALATLEDVIKRPR